ncbi:FecR family protein [Flavitalea sp. BT771]|uniref:FecR family protein n=1 Tax=Flavitalea sp. BT771 TaxID=3063329 RepID=UPI0026E3065F|nr:FecR family protein [Flavitalea sp. BT771]MDO6430552.1 FecR family protein [Flavitalea sp. BT771]MDV6219308.1 FecR family protein [Flavitalea sp. BT771]
MKQPSFIRRSQRSDNDINWFVLFTEGHRDAFAHYFEAMYPGLYHCACKAVADPAIAESIILAGFVDAWKVREGLFTQDELRRLVMDKVREGCTSHRLSLVRDHKHDNAGGTDESFFPEDSPDGLTAGASRTMPAMDVASALSRALLIIGGGEKKPFYKKQGWQALALCLALVAAGGGVRFALRHQENAPDIQKDQLRSAVPGTAADLYGGGNKATLTLAGGQQLKLQYLPRGNVALQYGARLIKTDSALIYVPATSAIREGMEGPQFNTLSTPRAGQYSLVLPDGTRVWLNSASTLSYPTCFNGRSREVTLTGEAYFEVVKNAAQPFHVNVHNVTIRVLGTGFTVRAYHDEGRVTATLLKGKIAVHDGHREKMLMPNEQVNIDRQKNWQIQQSVDPESVLAWKNHIFYFIHADIPTVMHELSLWYGIDVEIKVPAAQSIYDGEYSRDASLSAILNYLTNEDVHFVREGNKVTVTP